MPAYRPQQARDKPLDAPTPTISRFRHKRDTDPRHERRPWRELAGLLSRHAVRREKDGPLWSPVVFRPGTERAAANADAVHALVFDVDHTAPDWNLLDGVAFVAYTTYSHSAEDPHWRLVLRLERPVPAAAWAAVWRRGRARYAPMADPSCKDPCRMYYLPACPPGRRGAAQIGEGAPVDPAALPETPEEVQEREVAAARPPQIRSSGTPVVDGARPGDRFACETSWAALLEPHGWRSAGEQRGQEIWRRPGRTHDREARSANTTRDGNLWVWTSNAPPFAPHTSYTKLHAYVLLEHGGDWSAAITCLGERYGGPRSGSANVGGPSANAQPAPPYQEGAAHSANAAISARSLGDTGGAWTAPAPLAAALPAFPVEVLPGWLRTFVTAEAEATQTPPDLAAMLALAVVATTAARRVKVFATADWQEPINVYVAPALESGNRKSAVQRHVAAPLVAWEKQRTQEAAEAIAQARSRRKIAEAVLDGAQARAAKAQSPIERAKLTQEAEALAREAERATVPVVPRLLADDCTPEKLTSLMAEQGGRIATLSPEGDVFDLMGGRYGNEPNLGVYLKAHAGDDIRVDRHGRPSEYIPEPSLVLGLSPQPDVLKGLGERPGFRGRGLLARFLYALPESLLGRRDVRAEPMPEETRALYATHIQALLDRFGVLTGDDAGNQRRDPVYLLTLTDEAREALYRFAGELEPELGPYGTLGAIKDWAGKLAGAALRLAGLLHLAEHARQARPWEHRLTGEVMAQAITIGRYLIPHAQAVHDLMGLDPGVADARHVVGWIVAKRRAQFSKRDAFEATKGRFKKVEELDPALRLLEERGYLRRQATERAPGQRGRPPSPVYDVNPLLLDPPAPPPAAPPQAPSHSSQNSQNGRVPGWEADRMAPSQNSSSPSQNSLPPVWSGVGRVNGHVPAAVAVEEPDTAEEAEEAEADEWIL